MLIATAFLTFCSALATPTSGASSCCPGNGKSAATATPWVTAEERELVMPMKVHSIERTPVEKNPIRFCRALALGSTDGRSHTTVRRFVRRSATCDAPRTTAFRPMTGNGRLTSQTSCLNE